MLVTAAAILAMGGIWCLLSCWGGKSRSRSTPVLSPEEPLLNHEQDETATQDGPDHTVAVVARDTVQREPPPFHVVKNTTSEDDGGKIYFNNAGQGRFSPAVQQAGMEALHRPPWKMVAVSEEAEVRSLFAQLIGDTATTGTNTNIAVMPSTAFAITLAAHNIARLYQQQVIREHREHREQQHHQHSSSSNGEDHRRQAKILVLQDQYPSAIYPWQEICNRSRKRIPPTASSGSLATAASSPAILSSSEKQQQQPQQHNHAPHHASHMATPQHHSPPRSRSPHFSSSSSVHHSTPHYHYYDPHSTGTSTNSSAVTWSLHVVPYPEDEYGNPHRTWTESILEHLNRFSSHNSIQAVMVPPLHWADGRLIDLVRIGKVCHSRHIPLIVDATQAVGVMNSINVQDIEPTMVACSTYKWLRGPAGTSLVYLHPSVHDTWLPLDQHERGRDMTGTDYYENAATRGHFMDPHSGYYPEAYFANARKFDAGGKANPLLMPMLQASLRELVQDQVVATAQEILKQRMQPLLAWCHDHGFVIPSQPHAYHLIGIQPPPYLVHKHVTAAQELAARSPSRNKLSPPTTPLHTTDPHHPAPVPHYEHHPARLSPKQLVQVAQHLERKYGIVLQARCGGFRIAPYLDTTPEQVQALIQALEEIFFGSDVHVWQTTTAAAVPADSPSTTTAASSTVTATTTTP